MHIRHARMEDLDRLSELEAASYPAAEADTRADIKKRLNIYPDHFWILENPDGEILAFVNGFVTNRPDLADEMYHNAGLHDEDGSWQMLFSVVTAEKHRGRGYAGQLLRRVIADAREQHRKGLVLACKKRLIPFYARFGFLDEGISGSTHGNAVWNQMRLTFD